ncbi:MULTISPECIES: FKBP-type peptidyl-prolyl cis-trans isomerase [unclassified Undibacterium]|uniref:FKBP-type peptidyl-prolyl cis-trans isomerase n=1 Tax=unclassified Undibacterium TaxID=2630295 RepID=UPI002AC97943|nr:MULTISPECIES: FKBP-type peptidyl-prolyl cis-trans isomerase [unclassified Undibacterium]MEB0141049.1 FKBP-type peptidyl-prolyl cis-trans isomerase [Undibacterium sp. CCC2.1]MEB0170539.1 FKBP-type peptidyl-prolyl cis-trans isomerase [Undibacterium sp. CCC1.1]MEB0174480.1 FKBP-type peptidyl-prolyl cis-trans isomerase [Undibacterium sp. CCC3.4]MEB0213723.1 FKBP-type peptidyl-prolyl cis-trans isomerase [Undibacterium sp. 5I2]WPX43888.1 FKBP-type peptidyl-prolyl cis-trans isomerase [Undibacteriu
MTTTAPLLVTDNAYLTLHYRLATLDGDDILSTFGDSPATLQMGIGQLAPQLETALLGLAEGSHHTQQLSPEQAFGARNPELIQRVSIETLRENSAFGEHYVVGDLVDFAAPSGGRFAGILRAQDEAGCLFDFNHPLAGQSLVFETKIIGIM